MNQYQPSLSERKRIFLETCAGCAGDGFSDSSEMYNDGGTADADIKAEPERFSKAIKLDTAMNRVRRRKKNKANGN